MGGEDNLLALKPGASLRGGDYEIKRLLGAGGFGITYLAWHKHLAMHRAIKEHMPSDYAAREGVRVLPKSQGDEKDYRQGLGCFLDEARTLSKFRHAHIVHVHDVFEENNTAYMVMDYEQGKTLGSLLEDRGKLPEAELRAILSPLLDGLAELHNNNMLHRDLAPDNILIREDDNPVLLDFGAAREAGGGQSKSVTAIIKPSYTPPEQYMRSGSGVRQGPFTDIYALSATLYRAMTGHPPPDGWLRFFEVKTEKADPLPPIAPGQYSQNLVRAVMAGLEINPEDRPPTIKEWRGILEADAAIDIPDNERAAPKKRTDTGIAHEGELRELLRGKGVSADSVNSYVSYLHSVSHGLGEHITPELVAARTNDEILEEVGRHPTRAGGLPSARSLNNWRSALNRYREMCEARSVASEQAPVAVASRHRETTVKGGLAPKQGGGAWKVWGVFVFVMAAIIIGWLSHTYGLSEEAYQAARKADTVEDWVAFLEGEHGSGMHADEVRQRAAVLANRVNEKGEIPLHDIVRDNNYHKATLLIAAGADVNARITLNNYTPLHLAAERGHTELISVLAAAGADPNLKTKEGHVPLHFAAYRGAVDAVSVLINAGAEVSITNTEGVYPLHSATNHKKHAASIMKMLIDAGADINACDMSKTPPMTALGLMVNIEALENPKAEQFLRGRGARIETC